jgi:hypothetical protein
MISGENPALAMDWIWSPMLLKLEAAIKREVIAIFTRISNLLGMMSTPAGFAWTSFELP